MKPSEYLVEHGWRKIGSQGSIKYWHHDRHQSDTRGAFVTTDAMKHQKEYEANHGCDCIQPEEK